MASFGRIYNVRAMKVALEADDTFKKNEDAYLNEAWRLVSSLVRCKLESKDIMQD